MPWTAESTVSVCATASHLCCILLLTGLRSLGMQHHFLTEMSGLVHSAAVSICGCALQACIHACVVTGACTFVKRMLSAGDCGGERNGSPAR